MEQCKTATLLFNACTASRPTETPVFSARSRTAAASPPAASCCRRAKPSSFTDEGNELKVRFQNARVRHATRDGGDRRAALQAHADNGCSPAAQLPA